MKNFLFVLHWNVLYCFKTAGRTYVLFIFNKSLVKKGVSDVIIIRDAFYFIVQIHLFVQTDLVFPFPFVLHVPLLLRPFLQYQRL